MTDFVLTERRDATLIVTLNRPERKNAFTRDMITGLEDILRDAAEDATVRALVLTGADGTFCGGGDCLFDGIETALSFRGHSNTETKVEATTIIPGTIPSPGLNLAIATLDAYQPDITSLGMLYRSDRWRLGLTLEYQAWSDLSDEFESDTIKDQANLNFQDVLIPRLGGEFRVNDMLTLTGGVAFQESPLEGKRSLDVNYLDADRTLIGLGATLELRDPPVLAYPLSLSFGYQYQMIDERDFELTSTDPMVPVNPYETVTTEGDVSVFSGSMTMKF